MAICLFQLQWNVRSFRNFYYDCCSRDKLKYKWTEKLLCYCLVLTSALEETIISLFVTREQMSQDVLQFAWTSDVHLTTVAAGTRVTVHPVNYLKSLEVDVMWNFGRPFTNKARTGPHTTYSAPEDLWFETGTKKMGNDKRRQSTAKHEIVLMEALTFTTASSFVPHRVVDNVIYSLGLHFYWC